MCHNKKLSKHKIRRFRLFKIVVNFLKLLKVGTHDNTSFVSIVHQKNCIFNHKQQYLHGQSKDESIFH
jgi:hypothetical protein